MANEVHVDGALKWAPRTGRGQKAAYAFLTLEQAGARGGTNQFECAAFGHVAEEIEAGNLIAGDAIDIRGHLDSRRKKDDDGNWSTEVKIIIHEYTAQAGTAAPATGGWQEPPPQQTATPPPSAPPIATPPPLPAYEETSFATDEVPF